jgi:hypothetical protein
MYNSKDILFNINHYQKELIESYNLLKLLESGNLKGNNEPAQESIDEIKMHIKYLCFFTSCFLDIASSLRGLVDCETDWERKFYFKNGFVVIYESLKTFGKHQNEIRNLISKDFIELEPRFKDLTLKLKELKKEHQYDTLITKFRNKAGAHYDENFVEYFEHLNSIDKPISVKTVSDFSNFIMSLIVFWSDLTDLYQTQLTERMSGGK